MDERYSGISARLRNARRRVKASLLRLVSAACRRARPSPGTEPRRILIYGMMGIGNMILFTPAIQAIRRRFPRAEIVLLGSHGALEVLRGGTTVDGLLPIRPGGAGFLHALRSVRRGRFDVLVSSFHGSDHPVLTALCGIPTRVGHTTSPGWACPFDGLIDVKVGMEEDQHEVERGLALARALGADDAGFSPMFVVRDEDRARAGEFLRAKNVPVDARLVGVQADSWRGHPWKRWSTAKLADLCDRLAARGLTVLVMGAPGHEEERDALLGAMTHAPVVAMGELDLKSGAALLERCALAVTNDSGLMHVAGAIGTSVVALYGPTDHRRTSPRVYGVPHVVLRKDVPCSPCFRMEGDRDALACRDRICMDRITVEDALDAIDRIEA